LFSSDLSTSTSRVRGALPGPGRSEPRQVLADGRDHVEPPPLPPPPLRRRAVVEWREAELVRAPAAASPRLSPGGRLVSSLHGAAMLAATPEILGFGRAHLRFEPLF
jgi:hypothetical protein